MRARSSAALCAFVSLGVLLPQLRCARDDANSTGVAELAAAAHRWGPRLRFQPAEGQAIDLAVAERLEYQLRLEVDGEGDLPAVTLESLCTCLSVEFASPLTRAGADVKVTIEGSEPEDIDAMVVLQGPGRQRLAEYVVPLRIERRPFVQPRQVLLRKAEDSFTVGVYLAKDPNNPDVPFEPLDFQIPERRFKLLAFRVVERRAWHYDLVGFELPLQVMEDGPFEDALTIQLADPERTFDVPVRREH